MIKLSKNKLKKLPNQKAEEADKIRRKNEEVAERASELKDLLRTERSIDASAFVILLRPTAAKATKKGKKLDLGEVSFSVVQDLNSLKQFVDSNPQIKSQAYEVENGKVYLFPYGLPK